MSNQLSASESATWTATQYINERLDHQQKFHSKKSSTAQNRFVWLRRVEIIAAAFIPVLAIIPADKVACIQLLIGGMGALVTILASWLALGNYQQDWMTHRGTSEALKAQKMYFQTRTGPYAGTEKEELNEQQLLHRLVDNVEAILGNEHVKWQQQKTKPDKPRK